MKINMNGKLLYALLFVLSLFVGFMLGGGGSTSPLEAEKALSITPRFSAGHSSVPFFKARTSEDWVLWDKALSSPSQIDFKKELTNRLNLHSLEDDLTTCYFLLSCWAKTRPKEAMASIADFPWRVQNIFREIVFRTWVEKDPEAARQYYLDNQSRLYLSLPLHDIVDSWAQSDLKGAMDWTSQLPAEEQESIIICFLMKLHTCSPDDVAKVLPYISDKQLTLPPTLQQSTLITMLQMGVLHDTTFLINRIDSLPASIKRQIPEEYLKLKDLPPVDQILRDYGNNFSELKELLYSYPPEIQALAWRTAMENNIYTSHSDHAVEWVGDNLPKEVREKIHSPFTSPAIPDDPETLKKRIDSLPSGNKRSELIGTYVHRYGVNNYPETLEYLQKMNEQDSISYLVGEWHYNAPQEAEKWLKSSSLSDKQKNSCRSHFLNGSSLIVPSRHEKQ